MIRKLTPVDEIVNIEDENYNNNGNNNDNNNVVPMIIKQFLVKAFKHFTTYLSDIKRNLYLKLYGIITTS
jgi:hypothetical protein